MKTTTREEGSGDGYSSEAVDVNPVLAQFARPLKDWKHGRYDTDRDYSFLYWITFVTGNRAQHVSTCWATMSPPGTLHDKCDSLPKVDVSTSVWHRPLFPQFSNVPNIASCMISWLKKKHAELVRRNVIEAGDLIPTSSSPRVMTANRLLHEVDKGALRPYKYEIMLARKINTAEHRHRRYDREVGGPKHTAQRYPSGSSAKKKKATTRGRMAPRK